MAVLDEGVAEPIEVSIHTVRSLEPGSAIRRPTNAEVEAQAEADKEHPGPAPLFFWEDHSHEIPHPDAVWIRTFRRLACIKSHGDQLVAKVAKKRKHYVDNGVLEVRTFVVSAGGCVTEEVHTLCRFLVQRYSQLLREQSFFRRRLMARLSIVLGRFASRMFQRSGRIQSSAY